LTVSALALIVEVFMRNLPGMQAWNERRRMIKEGGLGCKSGGGVGTWAAGAALYSFGGEIVVGTRDFSDLLAVWQGAAPFRLPPPSPAAQGKDCCVWCLWRPFSRAVGMCRRMSVRTYQRCCGTRPSPLPLSRWERGSSAGFAGRFFFSRREKVPGGRIRVCTLSMLLRDPTLTPAPLPVGEGF